jgi:hypothetical protein
LRQSRNPKTLTTENTENSIILKKEGNLHLSAAIRILTLLFCNISRISVPSVVNFLNRTSRFCKGRLSEPPSGLGLFRGGEASPILSPCDYSLISHSVLNG